MTTDAAPGTSQDAAMSQLRQMHDTIVNDPASTPLALGMASVALDSVTQAALTTPASHALSFQAGFATGVADTLGMGLGGFGGLAGSLALSVTASGVVQYTANIMSS